MQDELRWVADSIRTLRKAKGMTQEQLAEKAEISASQLAKIETYIRVVGMKTYVKLLTAMNISVKDFFTYSDRSSQEITLQDQIGHLFHDCDEKELTLLLCSIDGIKKGIRLYEKL